MNLPFGFGLVVWAISVVIAMGLGITADINQSYAPEFPLYPMLLNIVFLIGVGAGVAHLTGVASIDNYQIYQPYIGGTKFVTLQFSGFLVAVVASIGLFVYHAAVIQADESPQPLYGVIGVLTFFGAAGTLSIVLSLFVFTPDAPNTGSAVMKLLLVSPNGESALVILFMIINAAMMQVAEFLPAVRPVFAFIFLVLHFCSFFGTHIYIGWMRTRNYRLFMPHIGSTKSRLAQAFIWIGFLTSLQVGIVLFFSEETATPLVYTFVGLLGPISVISLVFFVRTFDQDPPRSSSTLVRHGPSTLNVVAVGLCIYIIMVAHYIRYYRPSQRSALEISQLIGVGLLSLTPPLTHMMGPLIHGMCYSVFQPFDGGIFFVSLQATAWTLYATGLFFAMLHMSTTGAMRVFWMLGCAAVQLVAQILMYTSVRVYQKPPLPGAAKEKKKRRHQKGCSSGTASSLDATLEATLSELPEVKTPSIIELFFNGIMLNAIIMAVVGIFLRVILDSLIVYHDPSSTVIKLLLGVSTFFIAVATPLAQAAVEYGPQDPSSRHRIRPFVGPGEVVALQAIGWVLYGVVIIQQLVSFAESGEGGYVLRYTVEAVASGFPFGIIALSVYFSQLTLAEEKNKYTACVRSVAIALKHIHDEDTRETVARAIDALVAKLNTDSYTSMLPFSKEQKEVAKRREEQKSAAALWSPDEGMLGQDSFAADGFNSNISMSFAGIKDSFAASKLSTILADTVADDMSPELRVRSERSVHLIVLLMAGFTAMLFAVGLHQTVFTHRSSTATVCYGSAVTLMLICDSLIQWAYGSFIHGDSWKLFMPFQGGFTFVSLQAGGWGSASAALLLFLFRTFELSAGLTPVLVSAALSVISQILLLMSIRHYHTGQRRRPNILEENPEAFTSAFMFFAAFAFIHVYDSFGYGDIGVFPIIVSTSAMCLAFPLAAISLRRSARQNRNKTEVINSTSSDSDEDAAVPDEERSITSASIGSLNSSIKSSSISSLTSPRRSHHEKSALMTALSAPLALVEHVAFLVMILLPMMVLYAIYYSTNNIRAGLTETLLSTKYELATLPVVLVFVVAVRSQRIHSDIAELIMYLKVFFVFTIPASVVAAGFLTPFIVDSFGVRVFCLMTISLTFFGGIWRSFVSHGASLLLAYVAYVHISEFLQILGVFEGSLASAMHKNVTINATISNRTGAPSAAASWHRVYYNMDWGSILNEMWNTLKDVIPLLFCMWYGTLLTGKPEEDGSHYSEKSARWWRVNFFRACEKYHGFKVYRASRRNKTDSQDNEEAALHNPVQALYGYHPHGIFPVTATWAPQTDAFRVAMGKKCSRLVPFGATVIFLTPYLRDFAMSTGGRVVTKRAIKRAIHQGFSPLIVVGGQSEMMVSKATFYEMHMITYHTGFARIAIEHKVPLIPIISFGEQSIMSNIYMPTLQAWFVKRIGFLFPMLPMGWCYLPLPSRVPLRLVIGRPILPEPGYDNFEDQSHVQRLVDRYFDAVRTLFYEYRVRCGFPEMVLYYHSDKKNVLHGVPQEIPESVRGYAMGEQVSSSSFVADSNATDGMPVTPTPTTTPTTVSPSSSAAATGATPKRNTGNEKNKKKTTSK